MASKHALVELQQRLASRLEAAREAPRPAGWLAVEAGGRGWLLPLAQAGEIHPQATWLPLPHVQPWLLGVANLRGDLCAVVDLGAFLGLAAPPASLERGALVAFNASLNLQTALRVDRLLGLRDHSHLTPASADGDAPRPDFAGPEWADAEGRRWQVLDLACLAQHPLFLDVSLSTRPQPAPWLHRDVSP